MSSANKVSAVLARITSIWRGLTLAALAVVWGLSLVPSAQAQTSKYKITFQKMEILDDKEGGNGDWNLRVSFGSRNNLTLISNATAGTGQTLKIDKSYPLDSLPITVHATVKEHDGGIGAQWELVGSRSKTIKAPGTYTFHFSNSEGNVKIHYLVEELASTSSSQGVWRRSGALTASDPRKNGKFYDGYVVYLKAGKTYTISMSSASFDTFLKMETMSGTLVAVDDDEGVGQNSRIVRRIDNSGYYRIVTTSYGENVTGSYQLTISPRP
jgi:hypothetical protein